MTFKLVRQKMVPKTKIIQNNLLRHGYSQNNDGWTSCKRQVLLICKTETPKLSIIACCW